MLSLIHINGPMIIKTSSQNILSISAAFIWTHDIKLEIRAINKEDTTLLYAMFV